MATQVKIEDGRLNADLYSTIVLRHRDDEAAKDFIKFAHETWPFESDTPSRMTAISIGDMVSVADAMRMALLCEELDLSERSELALDLEGNCFTWAQCLAYAETEWELGYSDGQFVELLPPETEAA